MALTVVIAYDIAHDGRRSRVAAMLQVWGDRLQLSVFLCTLDQESLDDLMARIRAVVDPVDDSVYVLRQCANCWEQLIIVGQAHPPTDELCWMAM